MAEAPPAKRPRGRPPIPEDVQRRRLVTAAIRVFADKPYEGARIADIVREAKMSSRSFYQFFESKEDVVVEVYEGDVSASGELVNGHAQRLEHAESAGSGVHAFRGEVRCARSGRIGIAVRMRAAREDLETPLDQDLVLWA